MLRSLFCFLLLPTVLLSISFQEGDERPVMRRRPKAEGEFHQSYTEGTIFKTNSKTASGTLKRVECRGKSARIHVLSEEKVIVFDILDPKLIEIKGTGAREFEFTCGAQKPLAVTVEYIEAKNLKSIYSLEFKTDPPKAR